MNVLVQHIPHAVPVVLIWGIMLRFWLIQRRLPPLEDGARPPAAPAAAQAAPRPAVRRSVAVRGLLALGPLIGALATGLIVYAINLGRGHAGAAAVWTHTGLSLLALLLVGYKVADIGWARLRASITRRSWRSGGSIVLLVLWIPLLVSGIALLIFPSEASFTAYAHLISSVWWTGLLLWHLRHYLVRAVRSVSARPAAAGSSASKAPALAVVSPPARSARRVDGRRRDASPRQAPSSGAHGAESAVPEQPAAGKAATRVR